MNDEKIIAIAERLLEKSEKGEVAWSDTADSDTFAVDFPDSSISIITARRYYAIIVHNERGTIVESMRANEGDENYSTLANLFESARSMVLKSDEVLDKILKRLSGD